MSEPYYADDYLTLLHAVGGHVEDALATLPAKSAQTCVTSPPYFGLRDYGEDGQIGLEDSPGEYVARLVDVFRQVRRMLADDGTVWLNLGDSYSGSNQGHKPGVQETSPIGQVHDDRFPSGSRTGAIRPGEPPAKNLLGVPWRVAFALQDDGWILRSPIVWRKPNAMPESVTDRPSCTYELLFLLAKRPRYWFDLDAIREPLARPEALAEGIVFGGRNGGEGKVGAAARRGGANRSIYGQPASARPPGTAPQTNCGPTGQRHTDHHPSGTVLDPFVGSGTVAMVANSLGRRAVGIDLSAAYLDLAMKRCKDAPLDFNGSETS